MANKRTQNATREELRSRKAEEVCFLIQKYSYSGKKFFPEYANYCLRFIDEPYKNVVKKLKDRGEWYFMLRPAYELDLINENHKAILKELEAFNNIPTKNYENELSKILLKFGIAGIEIKLMFTEIDDRLEEILDFSNNSVLYSCHGVKPRSKRKK